MYLATSINDTPVITDKAGAAIADVRGKAVKYSSGALVLCSVAGEAAIGIGIMTNDDSIASGADVVVQIKEIGLVKAGAAVAKGAELMTDANGTLITATAGNFIIGVALDAAASAGQYIRAQITKAGYKAGAAATVALTDLTDVDLTTSPTNGQALVYDSTATKWKPASVVGDLGDLTDVDLTTAPTDGQVLKYNGTDSVWVPGADATE